MHHEVSKKTLLRVAAIHVVVILITLIPLSFTSLFYKKENVKFIEMVPLGTLNPAKGTPGPMPAARAAAPAPAPAPKLETPPEPPPPSPPPPPTPQPQAPPKPDPLPELQPISKSEFDLPDKTKPKTKSVPKPATETKINISTQLITRKTVSSSRPPSASARAERASAGKGKAPSGPSVSEIEAGLSQSLQTVGVASGNPDGEGMLGRPDGKASWYHSLIKETFLRHWKKPQLPGAAKLETFVTIRIAPNGGVTFLGISQKSGNDEMDESVLRAARAVNKLDQPLPPNLGNPDYDVTINFRLD